MFRISLFAVLALSLGCSSAGSKTAPDANDQSPDGPDAGLDGKGGSAPPPDGAGGAGISDAEPEPARDGPPPADSRDGDAPPTLADAGPDSPPSDGPPANQGDCPAVAPSLAGTYKIRRAVLVHEGGGPQTYSEAGTRGGDGFLYGINATIEAQARKFIIRGTLTKNGLYYFNLGSDGTWSATSTEITADGLGDTLYRRRFTFQIAGCSLAMKQILPRGSGTISLEHDPYELDLVRSQ
jgi:hypothetical protein